MNTDLLRETQIELRVHDEQLRVPETLKPHFVKPKPPPQQPNENTPRYVYFYDVQPVSSKDLIAFVRHQTDQQDNLKRSQSYLEEWGNEAALDIADSTWENALHKADPSTHDTIVSSIARAVADLCTEQGTTPKVPPEQAALWGPFPRKTGPRKCPKRDAIRRLLIRAAAGSMAALPLRTSAEFSRTNAGTSQRHGVVAASNLLKRSLQQPSSPKTQTHPSPKRSA